MLINPYFGESLFDEPCARKINKPKVYRENSKKCKSCKIFDYCRSVFKYHDFYQYKMRVDPNSIACSKYVRKKKNDSTIFMKLSI